MSPKPERQRPASTSPLGRQKLTASVEQLRVGDAPESQSPVVPEQQTDRLTDSGSPGVAESQTPAVADSVTPAVTDSGTPRYLTLVRKEARVRADQAADLAALRRRVSRNRSDRAEVITDNTLIRIAVDLLFARAGDLAGDTEEALRRSVVPGDDRAPESQSPGLTDSQNHRLTESQSLAADVSDAS